MGYRLEISKSEHKKRCGKLYGYVENEKELKSYKWLKINGFLKNLVDDWYDYNVNPKIILDSNEFKEFIKLYNEDMNENMPGDLKTSGFEKDWVINDETIQELLNDFEDKILEWY